MTIDEFTAKPTLTADGRPWVQRCFVCTFAVNFLKMKAGVEYIRVGNLVRHKKCRPAPIR